MKKFLLFISLICTLLLTACGAEAEPTATTSTEVPSARETAAEAGTSQRPQAPDDAPPEAIPLYDWGVTLTAENVTAAGLTLRCVQSGGKPSGELSTGSYYILERKTSSGWEPVEYLPQEYDIGWDSIAYIIPMNGETGWEVNWEWLYGELAPGDYRIGKEIMDWRAPGDYDKQLQYAEFTVYELCSLPLAPADTQGSVHCGIQD